jgi:tetratricopeptide (TPR) repeat protein
MSSSRRPNTLKHLPFFEVLASAPEGSAEARQATAGLLTLRMIDHWVLAGPAIVEPESVSVRSVRAAIMQLPAREPVREALLTVVNTMQMLRHVDLVPVLPRVFAYAQLLERHHGALPLAADGYESVIRLADAEFDAELVMDAMHRLSFCQRKLGQLDAATASSQAMSKLATRRKDRARQLRAKIGLGQVAMLREQYAQADTQFVEVEQAAERLELTRELAMATHNRAVVASRAGRTVDAVILAHRSLKATTDPVERDRVLGDLAAFLIQLEQYEAAIDALRIIEVTAASEGQGQSPDRRGPQRQ